MLWVMHMLWYGFCYYLTGSDSFTFESNSKKTSEPACYGSTYTSFVSLSCPQPEVVYPLEVYVGAKPNSTGCLDFENDYTEHDKDLKEKCCRNINETTDCTGEYNGPNRTLIIETCMGLSLCKNIHVVWESTSNMSCSAEHHYKSTTNYAYLDYFCIKSKIFMYLILDLKIYVRKRYKIWFRKVHNFKFTVFSHMLTFNCFFLLHNNRSHNRNASSKSQISKP